MLIDSAIPVSVHNKKVLPSFVLVEVRLAVGLVAIERSWSPELCERELEKLCIRKREAPGPFKAVPLAERDFVQGTKPFHRD